jgi:hypothetical protein
MLLQAKGYNVRVINAGLYGDTTTHMLQRVDSSVPNGTKVVVLDMGGGFFNDKFHNISYDQGEKDMHAIAARLHARGIKIVPEFSFKLPDKFKQADRVHLNAAGHQELAKMLVPEVITALSRQFVAASTDALPREPRQRLPCGISDRSRILTRPAQYVHRRVPDR